MKDRNWHNVIELSKLEKNDVTNVQFGTKDLAIYDAKDGIGRRYRRQDAIGTPLCITIDHDSLEDNAVTVRERDGMTQERIAISDLASYVDARVSMATLLS